MTRVGLHKIYHLTLSIFWLSAFGAFLVLGVRALAVDIPGYGPPAPGQWATTDFYFHYIDNSATRSEDLIRALRAPGASGPVILVASGPLNDFNFSLTYYVVSYLAAGRPVWAATCDAPSEKVSFQNIPRDLVEVRTLVRYRAVSPSEGQGAGRPSPLTVITLQKGEAWTSSCS
jgi:hypothetical protein